MIRHRHMAIIATAALALTAATAMRPAEIEEMAENERRKRPPEPRPDAARPASMNASDHERVRLAIERRARKAARQAKGMRS